MSHRVVKVANAREDEEKRREGKDNTPPRHSHREGERDSGWNISDGGKEKKKKGKKGVISAPKIVSPPSFLSPGNSLHRESARTRFRPTPYINDLPTALTSSLFNVPFALPRTQ